MSSRYRSSRFWLIAALGLSCTAGTLLGQRSVGVATGGASVRQYNQLASPLNYSGVGTVFTLGYYADATRSAWAVQLEAQSVTLSPADADALGSRAPTGNIRLRIPVVRQVAGADDRRNLRVGVTLVGDLFFRDQSYGREGSGGETYADAFAGFDGVLRASTHFGDDTRVSVELAAPVVRVAWRTPYAGLKYVPAAQIALPNRYRGVDGELQVLHRFSGHWSWTVGAIVSAFSDRDDWTLQHGMERITLGLRRRIGGEL